MKLLRKSLQMSPGGERTWVSRWTIVTRLPGYVSSECGAGEKGLSSAFYYVVEAFRKAIYKDDDRRMLLGLI
jgi:hypothetical protein